ncbi:hypothetical protein [Porphyromonas gingivalis]|uniref:Uncharacterized protein n=1 Tax=Porphyromonas gingivalis TaxID=837 RepID=A0AAF0BAY4_PORGN|nr:hypothetical protein [Porphyromonas gingivalis]WCF98086.1 hypothetical protein NY149_06025 [Porphyromonas gingivalis]
MNIKKSNTSEASSVQTLVQPLIDNAVEFVNVTKQVRQSWNDNQQEIFYEHSLRTYVHQYDEFLDATTDIITLLNKAEAYAEELTKMFSGMGAVIGGTRFVSILDISTVARREFSKLFCDDGWGS